LTTILITGCAGFIGSALCRQLLKIGGVKLVGIDNFDTYYSEEIKRENLVGIMGDTSFEFQEMDILDEVAMAGLFSAHRFSCVIHLAAKAGVRPSLQFPILYEKVNAGGTLSLLEAARKAGVAHLILASSSSVYGNNFGNVARECDPTSSPISPYAASKKSAELYAYFYSNNYGMDINVLRFFTAYGPSQRPDMAMQKFARKLIAGESIELYGGDKIGRDFTYIDDVVNGIIAAIKFREGFQVINIGSGREIKVKDAIMIMGEALDIIPNVREVASQPGDPEFTLSDISRARELLGYEPAVSIEEGIKRFVGWYLQKRK
jgi:UDP-glucuronate 4-epimerase